MINIIHRFDFDLGGDGPVFNNLHLCCECDKQLARLHTSTPADGNSCHVYEFANACKH